jgi:hypothetical protein
MLAIQESCPRCGSPDRRIRFATDEERVEVSGGESYTPSTFLDYVRALYDPLTVLAERYIPRLDGTHRFCVGGDCLL